MKPLVLDSSAMIAIALREKRGDQARRMIRAVPGNCFIHAVNAFEVVCVLIRKGVAKDGAWNVLTTGGVMIVDEIPSEMTRRAVDLKLEDQDLSLGDCHCLAFAEDIGGQLLTTDERLAGASKIVKTVHLQ